MARNLLHALTVREVLNAKPGDHTDGGGLLLRIGGDAKSCSWVFRYTAPHGYRRTALDDLIRLRPESSLPFWPAVACQGP